MADGALTTIYSHLIDALASNAVGTMCAFLVNQDINILAMQ